MRVSQDGISRSRRFRSSGVLSGILLLAAIAALAAVIRLPGLEPVRTGDVLACRVRAQVARVVTP